MFFLHFILFTILEISFISTNNKIITDKFSFVGNTYKISFKINPLPFFALTEINLNSNIFWINKEHYAGIDFSSLYTHKYKQIHLFTNNSTSIEIEAQITNSSMTLFSNETFSIKNISFYLVHKKLEGTRDSIGLGFFDNSNYNMSIVYLLYKQKLISNLQFGFSKFDERKVFYGGIPLEYTINKFQSKCKIKSNIWGCSISKILFNNTGFIYYNNNDYAEINTNQGSISVPSLFMEYFKSYLQEYMNERNYRFNTKYYCSCSQINDFPALIFVINGKEFEMNRDDLFEKRYGTCVMLIEENVKDNTKWILGNAFLRKYYSLFDYEKKEIIFYSDTIFKENSTLFYLIIKFMSFTMIINGCIMYFIYCKEFK